MSLDALTILPAVVHRLGALEARVDRLEGVHHKYQADDLIRQEAVNVARELGYPPTVLNAGSCSRYHRRRLAEALRRRQWTYQQIAHVMNCSERTIERYFAP